MSHKSSLQDHHWRSHDGYGCEEVSPGGFVSLMDLYENNYMRFRKLVCQLDLIEDEGVSRTPGCLDLHLYVLERSRYTTTVRLTYRFPGGETEPDLKLRIYHDAAMIEVIAGHLRHGRQRLDHLPAASLRMKWRLNRFLFKWLGYCLHMGHEISAVESVRR